MNYEGDEGRSSTTSRLVYAAKGLIYDPLCITQLPTRPDPRQGQPLEEAAQLAVAHCVRATGVHQLLLDILLAINAPRTLTRAVTRHAEYGAYSQLYRASFKRVIITTFNHEHR